MKKNTKLSKMLSNTTAAQKPGLIIREQFPSAIQSGRTFLVQLFRNQGTTFPWTLQLAQFVKTERAASGVLVSSEIFTKLFERQVGYVITCLISLSEDELAKVGIEPKETVFPDAVYFDSTFGTSNSEICFIESEVPTHEAQRPTTRGTYLHTFILTSSDMRKLGINQPIRAFLKS